MATSSSAATIRHEVEREGRPLLQLVGAATEELSTATDINSVTGWTSSIAHRPSFAHCEIKLASPEQKVIATAGSMLWMDGKTHMDTWCHNGLLAGWCRTCARESCCLNTFSGPGHVTFGFDLPGDILPFGVSEKEGWIMTSGSFICGTQNLDISAKFIGCLAGLCGGEGWFLTHVRTFAGKGVFYAGNYGQIQRHEVLPGKVFVVNSGLFFGASDKVQVEVGLPGGCASMLCSGEGAVMKFRGPCVIYTQNRNPGDLIALLNPGSPVEDGLEVVGKVLEIALEAASKQ